MTSQLRNLAIWLGAILIIVAASIFYQPAAAKTGSLLIWMNNKIYVVDIDTLVLDRIGPVGPDEVVAPAPGCFGQVSQPCWVLGGQRLYKVGVERNSSTQEAILPIGQGFKWLNAKASWSPDGAHLAYAILDNATEQAELRVYDASSAQTKLTIPGIDPTVTVAWTDDCEGGLNGAGCQLAYKLAGSESVQLSALTPGSGQEQRWTLAAGQVSELRWSESNALLYSETPRHFHYAEDETPAYDIPSGGQMANMSPNTKHTVYYQPFTLADCSAADTADCLHLGIWIQEASQEEAPHLIYNLNLATSSAEGLNFIPTWSRQGDRAVFFQNGRLIHYEVATREATIWYKPVQGKLRSAPIFSPNEEAVAFVDSQGQGFSEYRLVIVNPKLQPVEHVIETKTGIRLLAWLPQ